MYMMYLKHSKTILFADNTTLYVIGKNSEELYEQVNEDLYHLTEWFMANQFSVNASKTKYINIYKNHLSRWRTWHSKLVQIDELEKVDKSIFLGLIIDQHLLLLIVHMHYNQQKHILYYSAHW